MTNRPKVWWDRRADDEAACREVTFPQPGWAWDDAVAACVDELVVSVDLVAQWHEPRLLDLGCGIGRLTFPVAEHLRRVGSTGTVVGIDWSEGMVRRAETERRARGADNVVFAINDGWQLPDVVSPVACAWSVLLFQYLHAEQAEGYIAAVTRVLSKGGVFRVQWAHGAQHWGENDMFRWCKDNGLDVPVVDRDRVVDGWIWAIAVKP